MNASHGIDGADEAFLRALERGDVVPADFSHEAHVRLAYILLAGAGTDAAVARMRELIAGFLTHHGLPAEKYHETLTRAWILAVRHFMDRGPAHSAGAFLAQHPALLDTRIMLTHYRAETLFSADARGRFIEPDLQGIP